MNCCDKKATSRNNISDSVSIKSINVSPKCEDYSIKQSPDKSFPAENVTIKVARLFDNNLTIC